MVRVRDSKICTKIGDKEGEERWILETLVRLCSRVTRKPRVRRFGNRFQPCH